jgi:hypothetical protein
MRNGPGSLLLNAPLSTRRIASSRKGSKQCAFTGIDSANLLHDSGEHSGLVCTLNVTTSKPSIFFCFRCAYFGFERLISLEGLPNLSLLVELVLVYLVVEDSLLRHVQGFGRGHRRDFRRAVEQPEAVVLPMWDVIAEVFRDAAANGVEVLKAIRPQPVRLAFNLFCHVACWDHAA